MKITLAFSLMAIFFQTATAEPFGKCTARQGSEGHEKFCSSLNLQNCGTQSALCTWEKPEIKKVTIIDGDNKKEVTVIEEKVHTCSAKPGNEMHEAFCSKQNKQICATHSHICEWK